MEAKNKTYSEELRQYKNCDPIILEQMEKAGMKCIDHANRWTGIRIDPLFTWWLMNVDNIFAIKSYCMNQFGMESSAFDQAFNLPTDFDSIEP